MRDIVSAVTALARQLGLHVIAEGIEDDEQLSLLRPLGCEYGQGFLFSRPIDSEGAAALLKTGLSSQQVHVPDGEPAPVSSIRTAAARPAGTRTASSGQEKGLRRRCGTHGAAVRGSGGRVRSQSLLSCPLRPPAACAERRHAAAGVCGAAIVLPDPGHPSPAGGETRESLDPESGSGATEAADVFARGRSPACCRRLPGTPRCVPARHCLRAGRREGEG